MDKRLVFLSGLFFTLLIASNLMAIKLINIWGIILPAAVICYPFCFVVNDLINEFYGYKTVKKVVVFAFFFNAIVIGLLTIAAIIPPSQVYQDNEAFRAVFLSAPRILGASFTAFIISGILNSYFFDKIRQKSSFLPLRSAVSTFLGVIIDSFLFITLAYAFNLPFSNLMLMVLWQTLAKLLIGIALGTPMTSLIVALLNTRKNPN
jgi:uncharacterized integral membrane protein (TIGR00697 family)